MAGEPRGRGWRWRALALAAGVVLAWAAWLGVHLLRAASHLSAGVHAMDTARDKTEPEHIAEGRALDDLRRAHREFGRAHLGLTGPTWLPAQALPVVGRQLRSVAALSQAAESVSAVGIDGLSRVRELLREGTPTGPDRVRLVRQLADLAGSTERRLASIGLGPRQGLFAPLAERRNELADELNQLQTGLRRGALGGRAMADVLGGPRRYLVFAANNAEMRAGSGMFLSVGELHAGQGVLRLGDMRSVTDIPVAPDAAPLEGDLRDRWGWLKPNEEWRNLMLSPRFDVNARLAAEMWRTSTGTVVDGVLALDPVAVRGLLQVTGPVDVEGRRISADNVVAELLHDQYVRFPELAEKGERREQLGVVARATFDALDLGRPSLPALASELARAARGRHLLAWSARAEEQSGWAAAGVDGSLRADSLLLSVINRAGNKLDQFFDVSADLTFQPSGSDTECVLRVVLENRVPSGEPQYIAGPDSESGLAGGVYQGIPAVTLPGSARNSRVDGVEQLAVAGADGANRVVGFQVALQPGESRTVVFRFLLPDHRGVLAVEPTARVPPVRWSGAGQKWPDGARHNLRWRSSPARG